MIPSPLAPLDPFPLAVTAAAAPRRPAGRPLNFLCAAPLRPSTQDLAAASLSLRIICPSPPTAPSSMIPIQNLPSSARTISYPPGPQPGSAMELAFLSHEDGQDRAVRCFAAWRRGSARRMDVVQEVNHRDVNQTAIIQREDPGRGCFACRRAASVARPPSLPPAAATDGQHHPTSYGLDRVQLPHMIFIGLEDYKARGTQASLYYTITNYTEFAETKI